MQLHIDTCAGEGVSQAELEATPEAAENLAYTRYVLEAGYSGDFLDLIAALAPCVLGYGEIGARLATEAGETPYRGWIDTYAGKEYQDVCLSVGRLIDRALERRLGRAGQFCRAGSSYASGSRWLRGWRLDSGTWAFGAHEETMPRGQAGKDRFPGRPAPIRSSRTNR